MTAPTNLEPVKAIDIKLSELHFYTISSFPERFFETYRQKKHTEMNPVAKQFSNKSK